MLKVAVQGAGYVGKEYLRVFKENPQTEIVAVGSRTKEGATRAIVDAGIDCPVFDDYEQLLKVAKLDLIAICTPPYLHARETVLAAEHGKHIIIEKPVAVNRGELMEMNDAVKRAGVKSSVGFVLRWNPLITTIKKVIEDGMIGRPILIHADYWHGSTNMAEEVLQRNWNPVAGGIMLHGGSHAMDTARFVLGNTPITQVVGHCPEKDELDKQRTTVAVINFENGAIGKISASDRFHMPYVFNIEIFGDEGVIRNNRLYSKTLPGQLDFMDIPTILPDGGDVDHHPFDGLVADIVHSILNDVESSNSLEVAVNTHEACFAAESSAALKGKVITL